MELLNYKAITYSNTGTGNGSVIISQSDRQNVPAFIEYADTSIMFIKPSFSKIASSATKLGEALMMGKPVITNSGWGDIELFRKEIDGFYVADQCDRKEYRRIIEDLISNRDLQKLKISPFAQTYFSLANGIDKYYQVYKDLV